LITFLHENWRARWAVILTLVWVVWLGGSSVVWETASSRANLDPTWESDKHQAFTASILYAYRHGLGRPSSSTNAWPIRVEEHDSLCRLLGVLDEKWYSFRIPESPNGTYAPCPVIWTYAPLSFIVFALGQAVLGPESTGAQAASNVLLLGFVSVMAWHGWQLAGFRGAVLLGLATAASPWTNQWLRYHNYQSGALLMLAVAMVAAHASRGLTRPLLCACVGVSLGVGLLFTQLTLYVAVPWLIFLALPDLLRTRYSLLGGGLLLLLAQFFWMRYSWSVHQGPADVQQPDSWAIGVTASVLLLLPVTAWLDARRHGWRPATGLAVVVAGAGLVSLPYYLMVEDIQYVLIPQHMATCVPLREVLGALPDLAWMLNTFHWLGLLWLVTGVLLLARWRTSGLSAFRLTCSLVVGSVFLLLHAHVHLKFLVPVLPLALVPGFIWAARWKASSVGVAIFLIGVLWFQSFGWLAARDRRFPWLPVPIVTPNDFFGEVDGGPWWYRFPVADLPAGGPGLLDLVPSGLRLSLLYLEQPIPQLGVTEPLESFGGFYLECLAMGLALRGQLVDPGILKAGDHVLMVSSSPYRLPPGIRDGRLSLSGPDCFRNPDGLAPHPLFLQLRRVQSVP